MIIKPVWKRSADTTCIRWVTEFGPYRLCAWKRRFGFWCWSVGIKRQVYCQGFRCRTRQEAQQKAEAAFQNRWNPAD